MYFHASPGIYAYAGKKKKAQNYICILRKEKKNKISLNIITTSNSLCLLLRDDFKNKLEKITYNLQMNTKPKRAVSKR